MDLIHQLAYVRLVQEQIAADRHNRPTPYFVAGERRRRRDRHPGRIRRGVGRILVGAGQRLQLAGGTTR